MTKKLRMDRRGITIGGFIIGLIILSMVIAGFSTFHREVSTHYGEGDPSQFDKYNYTDELISYGNNASTEALNDDLSVVGFFTKGSWGAGKTFIGSLQTLKDITFDFASATPNFPAWAAFGFISIMSITLTLIILSAVFRHRLV